MRNKLTGALVGGALALAVPTASSALTVTFDLLDSNNALTSSVSFVDEVVFNGTSVASAADFVSVSQTWFGSFFVGNFSSDITGTNATSSWLNETAMSVQGGGVGNTLVVTVSQIGYAGGANSPDYSSVRMNANGEKLADSISVEGYVDNGNDLGGTITSVGSISFANPNDCEPGSMGSGSLCDWGSSTRASVVLSDPFSMTQVFKIAGTESGVTQFDGTIVAAIPVPATGVMLLAVLGGLGFARRRMSDT